MPSTEWVHDLKVVELKEECKKRGLPVGGKKAELVERLEAWIAENEKSPEGAAAADAPAGKENSEEQQAGEQEEQAAQAAEGEEEKPEQAEQAAEAEEEKAEAAAEGEKAEQPAAAAEEEPAAAPQEAAAAPEHAAAAPIEAEPAAEPAAEAPAAGEAEGAQQPSPAAAEPAGQAEAAPAEQQQAAGMEKDRPVAAAQEQPQPAAAADVDLDYGEDSDAEGGAAAAQQPAEQQQRSKQAEEAPKRKREEEQAAAAPRRVSGTRGPSADKAIAAAASQGSAERPSKVPRSGSGFSLSNAAEKGEAPAPEDVPEAEEPATRALRIDGFVRPFTERQVRELLSETGQVLALWMPSIKTHAYCVFETKAQAEATRRATYKLQWPATNPKRLAPRFVPLTEAETAIGTGAGNPDFRLKRTEEDGEEEAAAAAPAAAAKAASEGSKEAAPAVDRSKREWNRNRRSPSPPLEGVRDLREMLSRKASDARSADAPAAAEAPAAGPSRGGGEREAAPLPPGLGRAAERRSDAEPERRGSHGREEHPVRTLDELFRKTTAKPCIYWLPLTDDQVAEKKRKAAAAAEQAKQPAANGSAEKK